MEYLVRTYALERGKDPGTYWGKCRMKFEDEEIETLEDLELALRVSPGELWANIKVPLGLRNYLQDRIDGLSQWVEELGLGRHNGGQSPAVPQMQ